MEILAAIMVLAVISVVFWDDLIIAIKTWQNPSEQPTWKKRVVSLLNKLHHQSLYVLICYAIPITLFLGRKKLNLEITEAIVFACTCFLAYWIVAVIPFRFLDRKDNLKEDE